MSGNWPGAPSAMVVTAGMDVALFQAVLQEGLDGLAGRQGPVLHDHRPDALFGQVPGGPAADPPAEDEAAVIRKGLPAPGVPAAVVSFPVVPATRTFGLVSIPDNLLVPNLVDFQMRAPAEVARDGAVFLACDCDFHLDFPSTWDGRPSILKARPFSRAPATFRRAFSRMRPKVARETPILPAAASW